MTPPKIGDTVVDTCLESLGSLFEAVDLLANLLGRMFDEFAARFNSGKPQVLSTSLVADLETPVSAYLKLAELPRNSAANRVRNRCEVTGRPRGYYRKFRLSRIALRELGSVGQIPGLVKSSW